MLDDVRSRGLKIVPILSVRAVVSRAPPEYGDLVAANDLTEQDATDLAVEAQHRTRRR